FLMSAYFEIVNGCYVGTSWATSPWLPTQLGGHGVCGILARELEKHSPGKGFVPARFNTDLLKPVLNEPIVVQSSVVRDGRRMRVVDASIVQHGVARVRATAMFLAVSQQPPGTVWQASHELPIPTYRLDSPGGDTMRFKSGDGEWSEDYVAGQNGERKCAWHNVAPLVEGEPITPFQRAAFVADTTNMVCNWGTEGIGYINTDMTMTLSRLPEGPELGLLAQDHVAAEGISIATATMYDRTGPLGTCVLTG
ncbi:thioesterase family protein, partial [Nocardia gipuzkoensis]